jgi:hypothetical protein
VEFEPRGFQGWASIIGEGTPHGRTVAPHDFGFRITPAFEAPFNGADPTDTFFEVFLGMAVSVINGLRCLAEIMEVTQLVWHIGEHLRDGTAEGQWAVRHDADNRPLQGLTHCPEQYGEVRWGRRQQTAGQEDFPGETVPKDPQHLMADVRLQAIQGQDDPALGLGEALQSGGIGEREGEQSVVAFEQMRDRPRGDGHPAVAQVLMDFRQTTVLRLAQGPDACNDIEAKLVLG